MSHHLMLVTTDFPRLFCMSLTLCSIPQKSIVVQKMSDIKSILLFELNVICLFTAVYQNKIP